MKEIGGCPLLLVSDCGTENGIAASMQCVFRANDQDEQGGEKSHTAHRLSINELKGGGPFSGEIDLTGGLTYSRTWSIINYFIWEIPFT